MKFLRTIDKSDVHIATGLNSESKIISLSIACLLTEKGLNIYVKIAQLVKSENPNVDFPSLGSEDPSPKDISIKTKKMASIRLGSMCGFS